MKYCTKCGNEAYDEAVICAKCGCAFEKQTKQKGSSSTAKYIWGAIGGCIGGAIGAWIIVELLF